MRLCQFLRVLSIASAALISSAVDSAMATPIIVDDFDNGSIDATLWTVNGNLGSTPPSTATEAGSDITFAVGRTNSGDHVQAFTDPMAELNFFDQPIVIDLDITDLTGTPGSGQNRLWVGIGQPPSNGTNLFNFFPGSPISGVVVMVERIDFDNQERIRTVILSRVGSTVKASQAAEFQRPGGSVDLPESLRITIDDTNVNVVPTGASYFGATPEQSTLAHDLTSTDVPEFRLALGAYNAGVVGGATTAVIDRIEVAVVPEPGALGLGALGLLMMLTCRGVKHVD